MDKLEALVLAALTDGMDDPSDHDFKTEVRGNRVVVLGHDDGVLDYNEVWVEFIDGGEFDYRACNHYGDVQRFNDVHDAIEHTISI